MEGLLQVEEAEGYDHLLQLYRANYEENYFQYEERYDLSALHDEYFERWCRAETGVPIIDAGMTELNATGRMPNRIRILCATYLVKNLQCPFYLGERLILRPLLSPDFFDVKTAYSPRNPETKAVAVAPQLQTPLPLLT